MKKLHRSLVSFVAVAALLLTGKVFAQETFAPLLTESTIVFVHIDFGKANVNAAKIETKKLAEKLLASLGFDARSQRATLRDLDTELEKLDTLIRPNLERLTKELGITEIAFILDSSLFEHADRGVIGFPLVAAIPWKGKTDKDLATFFSILPDIGIAESCVQVGDFLIDFPVDPDELDIVEVKRVYTDWAKNAVADNTSPVLQAVKSLRKSDEIKAVVTIPKMMKLEMQNAPFPPEMPIQVRNLILFAVNKTEWLAASFSVSELLTGTLPKDGRLLTIKMPTADDAKMCRQMMESAIDEGIPALQLHAQSQAATASDVPAPLIFEFLKGYLRTLLPEIEGDTLFFRCPSDWAAVKRTWQALDRWTTLLFLGQIPSLNE